MADLITTAEWQPLPATLNWKFCHPCLFSFHYKTDQQVPGRVPWLSITVLPLNFISRPRSKVICKRQPSHEMLLRILLISRKNSPFPAWKHVWLNWTAQTETGRGKESVWLGLQIRQEGTNIQVSSLTPSKTVRIFQPLWIFFTSVDFWKGTLVFAYLPVIKVK